MLSTESALQPIIVQLRQTTAYMRKIYDNIEKIDNVNTVELIMSYYMLSIEL